MDKVGVFLRMSGRKILWRQEVECWHVHLCFSLFSKDEWRVRSLEAMVTQQEEESVIQC